MKKIIAILLLIITANTLFAQGRSYALRVQDSLSGGGGGGGNGRYLQNNYGIIIDSATSSVYKPKADTNVTAKLRDTKLNTLTNSIAYIAPVFNIVTYGGADSTGVVDATTAIRLCITAASYSGGKVFIPHGTFKTTDSIVITANNIIIEGEGESSKILASGDFGNIFSCHPTVTPTDQYGGIQGIQFRNFYIESSTTRTSGAAIYFRYSYNAIVSDMRIGTLDFRGNNTVTMRIYDGVKFEYESAAIVSGTQIYPTHVGVYFSGNSIGTGSVGNFYWDGLVTGNCNIWGKRNSGSFVTGSVGVYVAGGTGGVQIEQTNISWFENGVKASGVNRELFIGHAFSADDCGGAGIYITGSLNILQMTGGWAAGNARGAQTPSWNLYIDSTVTSTDGYDSTAVPRINITGGTCYASGGSGVYIGTGRVSISGLSVYGNSTSAGSVTFGGNVKAISWVGGRSPTYTSYIIPPVIRGVMGLNDAGNLSGGTAAGGSTTQVQFNNAGSLSGNANFTFTSGNTLTLASGTTTAINGLLSVAGSSANSTFRVGTLEVQNYSLSNSWLGDNVYFNGSTFVARATGAGALFYFQGAEGQFRMGASVSAGAAFTLKVPFKANEDGTAAIGGNISTTTSTYTGATLISNNNGVSIGSGAAPASSAILDLSSTTKALLLPRMTKTQRNAISTQVAGDMIYQTDNTPGLRVYNGTNWMRFTETTD